MYCSQCGSFTEGRFCTKCGAPAGETPPPGQTPASPPPPGAGQYMPYSASQATPPLQKKSNTTKYVLLGMAFIGFLIIPLFFFLIIRVGGGTKIFKEMGVMFELSSEIQRELNMTANVSMMSVSDPDSDGRIEIIEVKLFTGQDLESLDAEIEKIGDMIREKPALERYEYYRVHVIRKIGTGNFNVSSSNSTPLIPLRQEDGPKDEDSETI